MSSNSYGPGDGSHEQRPYTSSSYHRTALNTSTNVNTNNRDSYNNRDFYGVRLRVCLFAVISQADDICEHLYIFFKQYPLSYFPIKDKKFVFVFTYVRVLLVL